MLDLPLCAFCNVLPLWALPINICLVRCSTPKTSPKKTVTLFWAILDTYAHSVFQPKNGFFVRFLLLVEFKFLYSFGNPRFFSTQSRFRLLIFAMLSLCLPKHSTFWYKSILYIELIETSKGIIDLCKRKPCVKVSF